MECLPLNETFSNWLVQYGSLVLFLFLVLGIIALPIPDETLMIFAGFLMNTGKLGIVPTLVAAYLGSICGISISYIFGRTIGHYFIHTYGSWVGLTVKRLEKVEVWFQKYGKWTLVFGYFIPGIRHFSGLASGIANIQYRQFALFAYTGAIIWVTTFLSIGYFFGNFCLSLLGNIEIDIEDYIIILTIALFIYVLYKLNCKNKDLN